VSRRPEGDEYRASVTAADDPRWAAAIEGLDRAAAGPGDPVVVRDGAALLVRRGDVVVRVRPLSLEPVAAREVEVALVLDGARVPATPLSGTGQPWFIGPMVVTAWVWTTSVRDAGPTELGALAGVLRERTVGGPAFEVPRFDAIAAIRRSVEHLPVGDEQGDAVRQMAHELAPSWASVADRDPAGLAIVHGDLHRDNVVVDRAGPLLTDLELTGSGPPSYDAAPSAVAVRRYGADPESFEQFVAASGSDPRRWDGFETCISVYELWVTAWAVSVRHRSPELAAEAQLRVDSLVRWTDPQPRPWHLH
jgi:hypothetical protein